MWSDNEHGEWLLASQRGLLCRAQGLSLGVTTQALRGRNRPGGPSQGLLARVYLTITREPPQAQREVAALLYAGQPSIITGPAALQRHRIRGPAAVAVDVLVPAGRETREPGLRGHSPNPQNAAVLDRGLGAAVRAASACRRRHRIRADWPRGGAHGRRQRRAAAPVLH